MKNQHLKILGNSIMWMKILMVQTGLGYIGKHILTTQGHTVTFVFTRYSCLSDPFHTKILKYYFMIILIKR